MALTYGFYNSVEGDRKYDAIQMGQIFDGIITDGVYATFLKAMVVKASENASEVIVQPGRCWFNHTWTYIDADYPVEAPLPEVILDRVDALVIDINTENAFRENSLVWVQGTPSSLNPERPTLIKSVTHNQYPLCYVYRKAGTTMIYAADITNAVGTSETPFVTGVLTGINIDDLLAQWDDEFHTWEAATKTSFEAWMVNQQSVYVTWFDSIKDQMEGDLTDFEAWFETIRGIIDEEAATHLQAEIDTLSEMLPAGSHIDVSTSESTLFNRNVTVSDGVHSKIVQFDASGAATVESFPYIGIVSVTSTDGTRTAEESINIPYFGRYSAILAFWSATVNLVGDESLAAIPVTVRDSNGDVVSVVTLNAYGQGVFTATKPDEYKFIYTYGGQTMEVSLAVTQETTYEVEIHGGFDYYGWLEAGRVSKSFSSLDEILEDEPTLRQLFLVHDSIDFICDYNINSGNIEEVTKIFNTDLVAKWINLSDYALDHFEAVPGIKSIMDTADKYGYGEWCLMPQVPTMTSNTAPIGEVIKSREYSTTNAAWKAFDGDSSTSWIPINAIPATTDYVGYKFASAIIFSKAYIRRADSLTAQSYIIEGSNDNSTWTAVSDTIAFDANEIEKDVQSISTTSYLYLRLRVTAVGTAYTAIRTLQFYAWAPKGNVPDMTSNTAPYGTAYVSNEYQTNYAYLSFVGMSRLRGSSVSSNGNIGNYLYYKFTNPVNVRKIRLYNPNNTSEGQYVPSIILKYSDDGSNWTDTTTTYQYDFTESKLVYLNVSDYGYHSYWAIFSTAVATGGYARFVNTQFYGRELKGLVPAMTSNTAPYGVASGLTWDESGSGREPYKAFNGGDDTTSWTPKPDVTNVYLQYMSITPICVKKALFRTKAASTAPSKTLKLQASNDGSSWIDLGSVTLTNNNYVWRDFYIDCSTNNTPYLYHRFFSTEALHVASSYSYSCTKAQFYGSDSEKEFEVGATKKWLYDHGVELESLAIPNNIPSAVGSAVKRNDDILITGVRALSSETVFPQINSASKVDLTPYSLYMIRFSNELKYDSNNRYGMIAASSNSPRVAGDSGVCNASVKNEVTSVGISNVNNEYYLNVYTNGACLLSFNELWLE